LGDAHIQKRFLKGNSRLMFGQSSSKLQHLNYFNHVYDLFKPFLSEDFKVKEKIFTNKKTAKNYSSVNFITLSLPCFNKYRKLFYNLENIKIVPSNIENLLTPRGLAYWIMDDGSLHNQGLHLNTYSFTINEVLLLKKTIETMFSTNKPLKCSIHKHPKGPRIYI
jgi:hypothetical protein